MWRRLGYCLYQPYKWLIFAPFFVVFTAFAALSCILLCYVDPHLASRTVGRWWGRVCLSCTPATNRVFGAENLDSQQSYIVVANHISQYDIFALYGWLDLDLKWVMKHELRKIPIFGFATERLGHISIDRNDREQAVEALQKVRDNLQPGTSILFFPEGTRSRDGGLKHFKKGAFVMAKDLGWPILPISINGTDDILPPGSIDLRPGQAAFTIHPPIDAQTVADSDVEALIEQASEAIANGVKSA